MSQFSRSLVAVPRAAACVRSCSEKLRLSSTELMVGIIDVSATEAECSLWYISRRCSASNADVHRSVSLATPGVRSAIDALLRSERAAVSVGKTSPGFVGRATSKSSSSSTLDFLHDLVYGTYQQYMLFGKPWNCATEGNEHAHQDMKKFFKHLANHNPNSKHGDCYQVLV